MQFGCLRTGCLATIAGFVALIYLLPFLLTPVGLNFASRHTAGANAMIGWVSCLYEERTFREGSHRHFRIGMTQDQAIQTLNRWHEYTYGSFVPWVIVRTTDSSGTEPETEAGIYARSAAELESVEAQIDSIQFKSVSSVFCFFSVVDTHLHFEDRRLVAISDHILWGGP